MSRSDAFAALQRLVPQHALSRGIGALARSERPWIKKTFINTFARIYNIDLREAEADSPVDYASFNAFFTRALKHDARMLDPAPDTLVSPADGTISQAGNIQANTLLQAKGNRYQISRLAGPLGEGFDGGTFFTVYLAPRDYHRVHLPVAGTLTDTLAIPGELFSVNGATEASIRDLFCRNERLVCRFETSHGSMLVVLVGALIVASIQTVWPGPASPYQREVRSTHGLDLARGEEIGRFLLGSTVIVCLQAGQVDLDQLVQPGRAVKMGQRLGRLT